MLLCHNTYRLIICRACHIWASPRTKGSFLKLYIYILERVKVSLIVDFSLVALDKIIFKNHVGFQSSKHHLRKPSNVGPYPHPMSAWSQTTLCWWCGSGQVFWSFLFYRSNWRAVPLPGMRAFSSGPGSAGAWHPPAALSCSQIFSPASAWMLNSLKKRLKVLLREGIEDWTEALVDVAQSHEEGGGQESLTQQLKPVSSFLSDASPGSNQFTKLDESLLTRIRSSESAVFPVSLMIWIHVADSGETPQVPIIWTTDLS